jgi:hypothetical protein
MEIQEHELPQYTITNNDCNNETCEEGEELDSFTKGLKYFGKYDLGQGGDLSVTYKRRIKEILRKKFAAHYRRAES